MNASKTHMSQNKSRTGPVAALDLGTTKACCLIARPETDEASEGDMKIVGIGHQVSKGIRAGTIIDMEQAEATIRSTVEAAEQMAEMQIRDVIVNISCGQPQSRLIAYEVSIAGHEIGDSDIRRLLNPAGMPADQDADREMLHAIPVGYSVDGNKGVRDPRGLVGDRLGVNMHTINAASGPIRNMETAIKRCHLDVSDKVISPYASALACLSEDEIKLGVTCVDMGGGTTSISIFFDGELVFVDSIPVGGGHVTNDIARGLSTPISHAERIKTLFGSAIPTPSDDMDLIQVPLIGEEETGEVNQIPRSLLVGIVRPRIEETFELIRNRLEETGFDKVAGRRIVLTGGASQLPGIREQAWTILDKQARLGRPLKMPGLAEAISGPAFSSSVGLLRYVGSRPEINSNNAYRPSEEPSGRFARLGHWLRENF